MKTRFKKIIAMALAAATAFSLAIPTGVSAAQLQTECAAEASGVRALEAEEEGRQEVNISEGWKFYKGNQNDAEKTSFNDSGWEDVNIPHTWNAADGADGGGNYYRGDGWYRKTLKWDSSYENKRIYIQFLGANMQADVYVNGEQAGTHKGGYTAFRYDITDMLQAGKDNLIAVKVNNQRVEEIAPLEADFTFYGGIYREVSLILTEDVHVDTLDYAALGLKLTTTNVSKDSADLNIKSTIENNSTSSKTVKVEAVLREPETFEEVEGIEPLFDVSSMTGEEIIAVANDSFSIAPGESKDFSQDITVNNPRLWNGLKDPYRYQVDLTVTVDGEVVDNLTDYVGFRYFSVDYDKGFFLNGESYPLRGVCRHQDREGMGNALTTKEHDEDFALIYEIGANTIRLAHYPQAPYFYELCDKYGIVVWAEIPFVNLIGGSGSYDNPNTQRAEFFDVTRQQLVEMIRQQYNRPSICFWGLQNEVRVTKDSANDNNVMKVFMQELSDLAHAEDPTGRYTVQATDKNEAKEWPSDLQAWNRYPGWYFGNNQQWGSTYDDLHRGEPVRPMGASEYGIGSNISHHTENPTQNAGSFQSEEYQCISNELFIKDINDREWLWGTFYWNMFDFGSDGRSEGGLRGINTKGLVTFDRKTPKDVFYLYKAYWSESPFAYITSRRFEQRESANIEVKAYSNCDKATLYMNGKEIGALTQEQLAQENVFKWPVTLDKKENEAYIVAEKDGKTYTDKVIWKRSASDETTISSDVLRINPNNKTVQLNQPVDAGEITEVITSDVKAFPSVYEYSNSDGKLHLVESGAVKAGMILRVTSEDRTNNAYYTFVPVSLAYQKSVTATSEENKEGAVNLAENVVDGKEDTRWAASSGSYPQTITIDLGSTREIGKIDTTWFRGGDGTRSYKFKISVSDDNSNFTEVVDRTTNTTVGYVADSVNTSGRYVKIDVTGNAGNASIYEIDVFGTDYPEIGLVAENRLEAENAVVGGACKTSGSYVENIGNGANNKVTFTTEVNAAGTMNLDIYYIGQDTRDFEVTVNGGNVQKVNCPGNGTDWNSTVKKVSIDIELNSGTNTIELGNASAYAPNLDCIVVGKVEVDKDPEFPSNEDTTLDPDIDKPQDDMIMYQVEGESGDMKGSAEIYTYDNDKYVYNLGGNGDGTGTVSYKVVSDTAGTRKLRIYYCQQFGSKLKVFVNGTPMEDIEVAPTGAYFSIGDDPVRLDIELKEGENEIVFTGVDENTQSPYIDYFRIELTEAEISKTEQLGKEPEPPVVEEKPPVVTVEPLKKDDKFSVSDIEYQVTKADAVNGTVTVSKIPAKNSTVTIPAAVKDKNGVSYNVTAIAKNASAKNSKVKTLVIGENITNIGAKSFYNCKNLKKITFKGKNVPKLGKNAFKGIKKNCKVFVSKKMSKKNFDKLKKQIQKMAGKKISIKQKNV